MRLRFKSGSCGRVGFDPAEGAFPPVNAQAKGPHAALLALESGVSRLL